jgi:uncharacterized protein YbaA (DUF1428 family)
MAGYVDGFVLPVPKKNLKTYRRMATLASKVWKDHGALQYVEAAGDDLKVKKGCGVAYPRLAKAKTGETIVFAWIVYKSRKHRDQVNAKVMKDPRIAGMMDGKKMPFDINRMAYGGFKYLVEG